MYCWKCGERLDSKQHQNDCEKLQKAQRDSTYPLRSHYWKDLDIEELREVADRLASFAEMRFFECDDDTAMDVLCDSNILHTDGSVFR